VDVYMLWLQLEDIARRPRDELLGAQSLAELGHVHLDGVRRGVRRLSRPQCLHEPVDGHDATWLQREYSEQRARLRAAEPDGTATRQEVERAEQAELEPLVAPLAHLGHTDSSGRFVS
jgi:hypothetical protein